MRIGICIAAGTAALAGAASAATFEVDRTDDPAGPGACTATPNDCSLNQAAAKAGKRVSVLLKLSARTAAGAESTQSAKISKLEPSHKKKRRPH